RPHGLRPLRLTARAPRRRASTPRHLRRQAEAARVRGSAARAGAGGAVRGQRRRGVRRRPNGDVPPGHRRADLACDFAAVVAIAGAEGVGGGGAGEEGVDDWGDFVGGGFEYCVRAA
ncbi:hypothetical protein V490_05552, partial [Pseudogymnoascus sp. VKM F-3557]